MTWIIIAYLLLLVFLAVNHSRILDQGQYRLAWIWFACLPISHFVFALFQAGNLGAPRDLALVEIWSNGIEWLLLGISMICLGGAIAPDPSKRPAPPVQG